jgi:hypothetical protein
VFVKFSLPSKFQIMDEKYEKACEQEFNIQFELELQDATDVLDKIRLYTKYRKEIKFEIPNDFEWFIDQKLWRFPEVLKVWPSEGFYRKLMDSDLHDKECVQALKSAMLWIKPAPHHDGRFTPIRNRYWDTSTLCHAARNGRLECLKWLWGKGAPYNTSAITAAAFRGHLKCVQWMRQHCFPWDEFAIAGAAQNGHLECIKWMRENGAPWDTRALHNATLYNHHHVQTWLLQNNAPIMQLHPVYMGPDLRNTVNVQNLLDVCAVVGIGCMMYAAGYWIVKLTHGLYKLGKD